MRLPNALRRRIEIAKVTDYLLDLEQPDGGPKARFFTAFGFTGAERELFITALFDHPIRNDVEEVISTRWGVKYVVRCTLQTPDGRDPCVYSVWTIEDDGRPDW